MTLADRLRAALEIGHRSSPELIGGDVLDEEALAHGITPAAVLVAVVDRPDPTVILTLRPETMRKHPGQVSFPGGRIDPGDDGPIDAALREAEEEIGLARGQVEIIGLADRYRTVTGFEVTPVLGIVPPDLPLTPASRRGGGGVRGAVPPYPRSGEPACAHRLSGADANGPIMRSTGTSSASGGRRRR